MREGQESREHQRLQPDVITYSSLISACEKGKNPEQAVQIFASMEHQRVQLEEATYTGPRGDMTV